MRVIHFIALILVIIGALNWGMWGFFQIDVIASIFDGASSATSRLIYALVGLSGIWCCYLFTYLVSCDIHRKKK